MIKYKTVVIDYPWALVPHGSGKVSIMTCEQCKDLSDYVQHIFIMNGTYRCENCGRPYE